MTCVTCKRLFDAARLGFLQSSRRGEAHTRRENADANAVRALGLGQFLGAMERKFAVAGPPSPARETRAPHTKMFRLAAETKSPRRLLPQSLPLLPHVALTDQNGVIKCLTDEGDVNDQFAKAIAARFGKDGQG